VPGQYDRDSVQHVFTSKLVLTQLRVSIDLADVKRLYYHCKNLHRVIEGWAFEELVLRFLERAPESALDRVPGHAHAHGGHAVVKLRVRLESGEAHVEDWLTMPSVSFKTKVFEDEEKGELLDLNGAPILLDGFATGVMLRPDVTNNESWDAVRVIPKTTAQGETVFHLIFVEVTLQEVHSFNEMADVQMFKKLNAMLVQRVVPEVLSRVYAPPLSTRTARARACAR
jgi:hypothetical protein